MLITKNDVGRKVRLRNGDLVTIVRVDDGDTYPVNTVSECYTEQGHRFENGEQDDTDIVAFADEPAKSTADVSVEARAAEGKTLRDEVAMMMVQHALNSEWERYLKHGFKPFIVDVFSMADDFMAAREGK